MADQRDRQRRDPARRRRYEPPQVVDLGELARVTGGEKAACRAGSNHVGVCKHGTSPQGTCDVGIGRV